jgi:hypothetical protein
MQCDTEYDAEYAALACGGQGSAPHSKIHGSPGSTAIAPDEPANVESTEYGTRYGSACAALVSGGQGSMAIATHGAPIAGKGCDGQSESMGWHKGWYERTGWPEHRG